MKDAKHQINFCYILILYVSLFSSGYDFGYMLKVLNNTNLPADESEFFELLKIFFSRIYDVKYLMKSCKSLKGGLQEVSELLEVSMVEKQHLCNDRRHFFEVLLLLNSY